MARPRKYIDKDEFEKLCGLQCTKQEICGWFDVTNKTLDAWVKRTYRSSFSEVFGQKRSTGRVSLRRSQFRMARSNPGMAIWLGKQYLGQHEPEKEEDSKAPVVNIICDIPREPVPAVPGNRRLRPQDRRRGRRMQEPATTDIITPTFYSVFRDVRECMHTYYDLFGGRGSTKF